MYIYNIVENDSSNIIAKSIIHHIRTSSENVYQQAYIAYIYKSFFPSHCINNCLHGGTNLRRARGASIVRGNVPVTPCTQNSQTAIYT